MDTNELILRVAEALEKQMAFPQWDTIIQIFSVLTLSLKLNNALKNSLMLWDDHFTVIN